MMPRHTFGGTANDLVLTTFGLGSKRLLALKPDAPLTFWDSFTGGTQYTDLLLDGNPVTFITSDSDGLWGPVKLPNDVQTAWVDDGDGTRHLVVTTDAAIDLSSQLSTRIHVDEKGAASGVATLDAAGTVPDAQIPAEIARDTEVDAALDAAVAPSGKVWKVGPTAINVRHYDVRPDRTAAENSAGLSTLTTDHPAGVLMAFPDEGIYQLASGLPSRNNLHVTGRGVGTVLRVNSGSLVAPTSTISGLRFSDIALDNWTGASHLFDVAGTGGLVHAVVERCQINARVASTNILRMRSTNLFDVRFRDCRLYRTPGHTVPAFDIETSGSGVNNFGIEGGWMHSQAATGTPFFQAKAMSTSAPLLNLTFERIIGEQNVGGLIHLYGAVLGKLENITEMDSATYDDDLIRIAQQSGGHAPGSCLVDQVGTAGIVSFAASKGHLMITAGADHRVGRILNGSQPAIVSVPANGAIVRAGVMDVSPAQVMGAGQALGTAHRTVVSTGGAQTFTLPDPVASEVPAGRDYRIKNQAGAGDVTVNATNAVTVDGAASVAVTPGTAKTFVTDGSVWYSL